MSIGQENIDKILRDKLENASSPTPESAWDKIEHDLDAKANKKRIFIYKSIASIAAISVIIMGIAMLFFFNQNTEIENQIAAQQQEDSTKHSISEPINRSIDPKEVQSAKSETTPLNVITDNEISNPIHIASNNTIVEEEIIRTKSDLQLLNPLYTKSLEGILYYRLSIIRQDLEDIQKAIDSGSEIVNELLGLENNDQLAVADVNKDGEKRWSLGGGFSPAYQTNDVSFFPQKMADNVFDPGDGVLSEAMAKQTENTVNTYTAGINVNYQLSKRWSIQSGVNYLQQGLKIENFAIIENSYGGSNNYSSYTSNGDIEIRNVGFVNSNAEMLSNEILDFSMNASFYNSYLRQSFEFIEIPFIFRYKFINKKLGMYLMSGINTNIMVGNSVYLGSDNKNNIGTTTDVNKLIYSSLFGITIEYPLLERLQFSISPALKYQINSIRKGSDDFMNTSIFDFKTGLVYTFE